MGLYGNLVGDKPQMENQTLTKIIQRFYLRHP
jgi:hypothetical protein